MERAAWKLVLSVCALSACAEIFGIHNADTDGGGADASSDTTVSDTGGGDATPDVVEEVIIPDANFATCDGGLPALAPYPEAIYVDGDGGLDSLGCGSPKTPCRTIVGALQQYQDAGAVYVAAGTYDENPQIALRNDFLVQGGFDDDGGGGWTQVCTTAATIVHGVVGPFVVNGGTNVTLRFLTIVSKDIGGPSETVTALRVLNQSTVTVDNVVLVSGFGGDGNGGAGGLDAGAGCSPWPGGGNGNVGSPGDAGSGTWQQPGWTPIASGSGGTGETGLAQPGAAGACTSSGLMCTGIGGDAGATCAQAVFTCCGPDGGAGCGGFGGGGGAGGGGGGASVALYVWGKSIVTVKGGAMFATRGGIGGAGGPGGTGHAGMNGFDAGSAPCCVACFGADAGCGCSANANELGGTGGQGGTGGLGGQGGGGAGGPTYLIVAGLDSGVTYTTTILDGGPGGSGGSPNGAAGSSGVIVYP